LLAHHDFTPSAPIRAAPFHWLAAVLVGHGDAVTVLLDLLDAGRW
jgi:hypothetical protein